MGCFTQMYIYWVDIVTGTTHPGVKAVPLWSTKQDLACCIEKESKNVEVYIRNEIR